MQWNDRRPGRGQLDIFGGEVAPEPTDTAARTDERYNARLAARESGHNRWESLRNRMHNSGDYLDAMTAPLHPVTGFPTAGLIHQSEVGIGYGTVPEWAGFKTSSKSARYKYSQEREIPIQSAEGPAIYSPQQAVSAARVHEQFDNPATASNPRLGRRENPYVFHDRWTGKHVIIDGNHRIAGALMRNEMFQPVRLIEDNPETREGMQNQTDKIDALKFLARARREAEGRYDLVRSRSQALFGR